MDDRDRRAIVLSEHNAAAAEGYHKALVKMQAENKELKAALLERDSEIARLHASNSELVREGNRHSRRYIAELQAEYARLRVAMDNAIYFAESLLAPLKAAETLKEALQQSGDTAGGE